jgi:hypothetical protein
MSLFLLRNSPPFKQPYGSSMCEVWHVHRVTTRQAVRWDVVTCSLVDIYRRFTERFCFHLPSGWRQQFNPKHWEIHTNSYAIILYPLLWTRKPAIDPYLHPHKIFKIRFNVILPYLLRFLKWFYTNMKPFQHDGENTVALNSVHAGTTDL